MNYNYNLYQQQQPWQQYNQPQSYQLSRQQNNQQIISRSSSMAMRGQQSLQSSTQMILLENQLAFEDAIRKKQIQAQQQQQQLQMMLERQSQLLQNLFVNNMPPQQMQPQVRQPQRNFQVNLKSILLKPLEYYSQQQNQVIYQPQQQQQLLQQQRQNMPQWPYQQQDQQEQQLPIPQRPYGFRQPKVETKSIELQTDDDLTQYEKHVRMGLANTVLNEEQQEQGDWGPSDEQEQQQPGQVKKAYRGKDWNFQAPGSKAEVAQGRLKSRPLPPGMTRQQRAKQNLQTFKISMRYLLWYWAVQKKQILDKKQQGINDKGNQVMETLQAFVVYFKTTSGKVIETFASSKADIFITDKKKVLEDEMNKRIENLKTQTRKFFKTLVENFDSSKLPSSSIEFFGTILNDFEYLPQNFLFNFEINRFEYTEFGQLKNMNVDRQRMLIITLLFTRVYLFRMILKPWTDFPDIKKRDWLAQNCYQVGTVLYEISMEYIKSRCFKIGQNQAHLSMEFKNFPRALGPLVLERYELPEDPQELRILREQEEPLILGLEKREDMKVILEDDPKFVAEMEAYLEEWADSINDLVKVRYTFKQTNKKKERYQQKLAFIQETFKSNPEQMKAYLAQANDIYNKQPEQKSKFYGQK